MLPVNSLRHQCIYEMAYYDSDKQIKHMLTLKFLFDHMLVAFLMSIERELPSLLFLGIPVLAVSGARVCAL